ncbi:tetra-peptide repeat homeobox protein 1-like [Bacillus rossius redtenbacheri]|uniref:tetra-peptide repeat homeobox protein 1-like n=1 Tax=Bacillus rossius redtenbacheri TaxID=93214 RepID=UPI002FDC9702
MKLIAVCLLVATASGSFPEEQLKTVNKRGILSGAHLPLAPGGLAAAIPLVDGLGYASAYGGGYGGSVALGSTGIALGPGIGSTGLLLGSGGLALGPARIGLGLNALPLGSAGFAPLALTSTPAPFAVTTVNRAVAVPVPQPFPVAVNRPVPVPVPQPYPVRVDRPVPVPVAHPVPLSIPRPYPVPVDRPVPVPVAHPVGVPVPQPYPVAVPVPQPAPVLAPALLAQPALAPGGYGLAGLGGYGGPFARSSGPKGVYISGSLGSLQGSTLGFASTKLGHGILKH